MLSVIRRMSLVTFADCGISMWLPRHALATRIKRAVVTVLFGDSGL